MASRFDDPNSFRTWGEDRINGATKQIAEAVSVAVTDGASVMKQNIMTRGTNRDWGKDWPSRAHGRKSGSTTARYDTGEMVNSVQSTMTDVSPSHVSGEFGWLYNQQDYFIYQDYGFVHHLSHQAIPAVNALRDAYTHAIEKVKQELSKAFK